MAVKFINVPDLVCKAHPKYKALRKPTGKCKECLSIYRIKNGVSPHGNEKFTCFISGRKRTYGELRRGAREAAQRLMKWAKEDPNPTDSWKKK